MVTVIGIDPGLAATGIGIVTGEGQQVCSHAYGAINTRGDLSLAHRLDIIYSKLTRVLKEKKPDLMVVEDVFSLEKYPKSGITLGKVCGGILLAGYQADVAITEVAVRQAKQILTGNGNAGKDQLEKAVRHTLCLSEPIRPYHASDALGLALIGLFRFENYMRLNQMKSNKKSSLR
ncbi:MAG: crossover junction endodeoxyribonuclease RuvC [Desulfobacteraceae bacterium]|nr:crossover junction endodeoxyribonuclease RuvC [Desulfobacteraceae bacterium]